MSRALKIKDPEGLYFVTFTVVHWIDLFIRKEYKDILIDSLKHCQENKGLVVHAFVIMTSHVHLIVSRKPDGELLSDIIRDFKKYTSGKLLKAIREIPESRREWLLRAFGQAGKANPNNSRYQAWITGQPPRGAYHKEVREAEAGLCPQQPRGNWDSLFAIRLRLFVGVCVCWQTAGMPLGGRVD